MVDLKPDETLDDLLIQNLKIIQKKGGVRFTLDSVLLAHFATVKSADNIVDLGTGTGVIPLILSTRSKKLRIRAIEIQEELVEMALRSVKMNALEETIAIIQGDIKDIHYKIGGGSYTLVTANPPYWTMGEGILSSHRDRAMSRHEVACDIEDVVRAAGKLLNYQGRFAFIYPAHRFVDTMLLLRKYSLEPRRLRFVHSDLAKPARHFLLEARKSAAPDLKIMPPLVVYEKEGQYSREVLEWYGKGGV